MQAKEWKNFPSTCSSFNSFGWRYDRRAKMEQLVTELKDTHGPEDNLNAVSVTYATWEYGVWGNGKNLRQVAFTGKVE